MSVQPYPPRGGSGGGGGGTAATTTFDDTDVDYTAADAQAAFEAEAAARLIIASAIADHLADTLDAHDASAISVLDAANHFTGTTVEACLLELFTSTPILVGGLIPDSFIPSAIARDAEVSAAVSAAVSALVAGAPGLLDTLDELAAALGDDPSFATTITTLIGQKVAASLYNAHTILAATTDDNPAPVTVGEDTLVGRITGGNIAALTPSQVRTMLSLVIGTNVQAYHANLAALSGLTGAADKVPFFTGAGALALTTVTGFARTLLAADDQSEAKDALGIAQLYGNFGGFVALGHSYSQLGSNGLTAASLADTWTNFTHLLTGALGIPTEETFLYGRSGAQLTAPGSGESTDPQGIGVVLQHIAPSASYVPGATRPTGRGYPALFLGMWAYNDVLRNAAGSSTLTATAFKHALRTFVARARAAMVYDSRSSRVAYTTGFATTTSSPRPVSTNGVVLTGAAPDLTAGTGPSWRIGIADNDKWTFTVPDDWTGGTITATLFAPPGVYCYLKTAINNSTTTVDFKGSILGDLGYKNLAAGDVVLIDSEKITLGSTADGGITWTGCTRGGGAGAASHSVSAVVTLPTDQIRVVWTDSTASGASGHADTPMSGLGASTDGVYTEIGTARRCGVPVTVRFTIPAADAGLTIVGKIAGKAANEYVGFDHVSLEDPTPPPVVLVNQPDMGGTMLGGGSFFGAATATAFNTAISDIVSEFGDGVLLADFKTEIEALYKATIQTAISSGATTTIHVTPVDPARNLLSKGRKLRVKGATGIETMLVTSSVTKTSDTDWSFTVTRNYDSAGAQTTIALGNTVNDTEWLAPDWIHPSQVGHRILARCVLSALADLNQSVEEIVATSGLVGRRKPRMKNGGYLYSKGVRATIASPTIGDLYLEPFEVTEQLIVVDALLELTAAANASGTLRFGIFMDGAGVPGTLLAELGTVSQGSAAVRSVAASGTPMTGGIWVPLKPGWYWRGVAYQGTGTMATTRCTQGGMSDYPIQSYTAGALVAPSGTNAQGVNGLRATGFTGALSSNPGITADVGNMPMIQLQVKVPERD